MNDDDSITEQQKEADRAIWQAGYDARMSGDLHRHVVPYDAIDQTDKYRCWLAGYSAANHILTEEK